MRRFSIVLLFIVLAGAAYGWFALRKPPKPMEMSEPVRIHQGVVIGGLDRENPDIIVFNGIPYATARRWSPPSAPPQWGAIARDTREYGPECLQSRASADGFIGSILEGVGMSGFEQMMAKIAISLQKPPPESEDCLSLNIRTGNLGGNALQPVMVWIHGGSHQFGSGSQAIYQANGLVEKGVVLVTINYRLGAFGYLAHPALTEEAGTSGNYGLMDQVSALNWVRENVAVFGGDPNNVTVFGESAGAQSITELMATPMSEGLFHKAILQSGASTYNALHLKRSAIPGVKSAEETGIEFLSTLVPHTARAADLRAISASAIIARAEARPDLTPYFLPVVDGRILPRSIGAAFRDGETPAVPMIAGYNADEGSLFYPAIHSPTVLRPGIAGTLPEREAAMAGVFGLNPAKALQALYGMNTEESWDKGATDMLGDDMFGVHMRFVGHRNVEGGAPTYLYQFTRVPPSPNQTIGAFHAAEIPFVFNSHLPGLKVTPNDLTLTEAMMTYWTNFARTGDPNGTGVPEWPSYSLDRDVWLDLNHSIRVIEGLRARKLDILEETLLQRITQMSGPRQVLDLPEPVAADERALTDTAPTPIKQGLPKAASAAPPAATPMAAPRMETPIVRTPQPEPQPQPQPQPQEELPAPILRPLNPPAPAVEPATSAADNAEPQPDPITPSADE
ncbi:carboxylesterase family protein [Hyphomonas sp. WL0036]|uniref:carboxylesterase/lipase family protein n=1 Tax=Hyphomonas sediminis TaxID=2866160 RepID=UPI001C80BB07|nr:carboxylesterase family protein [Hyphomonas sediminis]MBY9067932.1 carboxylesterase family protein [Hyphomonas sediminis]